MNYKITFALVIIIAFAFIMGMKFYSATGVTKDTITFNRLEKMMRDGDVKNIEVINELTAHIFIKKDRQKLTKHIDTATGKPHIPNYEMNVGSIEAFRRNVDRVNNDLDADRKASVVYTTETNWLSPLMIWILPILLTIAMFYAGKANARRNA